MSGADAGRVSGIEAEQSVIGSMLIDPRCVGPVLAALREEDFSDPACRNTFTEVRRRFLADEPVDVVVLAERMGDSWVRWARDVMAITPTAANVEAYAEVVKSRRRVERFRELCARGAECDREEDAQALAMAMSGVFGDAGRMRRMAADELARDFLRRMGSTDKPEYLPWGLPSANRAVFAQRGDLCLLGGYPSAGKTLLSIQMALSQAEKYRVVYYSLETQPEKMADRIFSHMGKIRLEAIKRRELGEAEMLRAARAASEFATRCPFEIVQAAQARAEDVEADALSRRAEIVYIDYLQQLEAQGRDRFSKVTEASRSLKLFAQRHRVAVVALAQLSRPDKDRNGRVLPPSMSSFRESGQIEQDADAAFLLWRLDERDNFGPRVLKLAKNKEGRKFTTVLAFEGDTQTMRDLETRPEEFLDRNTGPSIAGRLCAQGRAAKSANRAAAMLEQSSLLREVGPGEELGVNPFERGDG